MSDQDTTIRKAFETWRAANEQLCNTTLPTFDGGYHSRDEEVARLIARIGVLESALKDQWQAAHYDHCSNLPHKDGETCHWPCPVALADPDASTLLDVARAGFTVLADYHQWESTTMDMRSVDDVLGPLQVAVDKATPGARAVLERGE